MGSFWIWTEREGQDGGAKDEALVSSFRSYSGAPLEGRDEQSGSRMSRITLLVPLWGEPLPAPSRARVPWSLVK